MDNYDFSGYATRNDLQCADGRVIRKDAFKHNDGRVVPLVWNHQHNDPTNTLGHALLENREDGVYTYASFNESASGKAAKESVRHGDVTSLSIYANKLQEKGKDVIHGVIREVSLVLAGANPGAFIDTVMLHGDEETDGLIVGYDEAIELQHSEPEKKEEEVVVDKSLEHAEPVKEEPKKEEPKKEDPTIQEVIDTMTDDQKNAMYALVGMALEDAENQKDDGGEKNMKHNLFENDDTTQEGVIAHSDMVAIMADAQKCGSLKNSVIAHGITDIDYLFPDATNVTATPQFIQRDNGWVQHVVNKTHHTPFSRIKSLFADITADDARAKGYVKGNLKIDEVFTLLKRVTTPTTVYKKQKLDRDDIVDITDFDVVAWMKTEMRMMLDEELARAVLVGDGRLSSSDDKISETCIRPIWTDADLYTIKAEFTVTANATDDNKAKAFIRASIKARKDYKGSGDPTLYITEDVLTDCLLLEDTTGRIIYDSIAKLAAALRVKEIVTVPVMEGLSRTSGADTLYLRGIITNLVDYNMGADKGGAVNMFDDFDIDYNAQKYLIETRCSGALIRPYSAIAVEMKISG